MDGGGRDIGILGERCTEDLAIRKWVAETMESGLDYSSEHLLWVGMAEAAFIGSGYGSAESGEEDNVIGMFLEDILQAFLELCHYGGRWCWKVLIENTVRDFMIR